MLTVKLPSPSDNRVKSIPCSVIFDPILNLRIFGRVNFENFSAKSNHLTSGARPTHTRHASEMDVERPLCVESGHCLLD